MAVSLIMTMTVGKVMIAYVGAILGYGVAAGPIGCILSIIFLVSAMILLLYINICLKDTPLESYLSNCILSSKCIEELNDWEYYSANELVEKILNSKDEIVGNSFQEWKDLKFSYEEFGLLTSNSIVEQTYNRKGHIKNNMSFS